MKRCLIMASPCVNKEELTDLTERNQVQIRFTIIIRSFVFLFPSNHAKFETQHLPHDYNEHAISQELNRKGKAQQWNHRPSESKKPLNYHQEPSSTVLARAQYSTFMTSPNQSSQDPDKPLGIRGNDWIKIRHAITKIDTTPSPFHPCQRNLGRFARRLLNICCTLPKPQILSLSNPLQILVPSTRETQTHLNLIKWTQRREKRQPVESNRFILAQWRRSMEALGWISSKENSCRSLRTRKGKNSHLLRFFPWA